MVEINEMKASVNWYEDYWLANLEDHPSKVDQQYLSDPTYWQWYVARFVGFTAWMLESSDYFGFTDFLLGDPTGSRWMSDEERASEGLPPNHLQVWRWDPKTKRDAIVKIKALHTELDEMSGKDFDFTRIKSSWLVEEAVDDPKLWRMLDALLFLQIKAFGCGMYCHAGDEDRGAAEFLKQLAIVFDSVEGGVSWHALNEGMRIMEDLDESMQVLSQ